MKPHTVYTLGPVGTDSERVAKLCGSTVELCDSFRSAFRNGIANHGDVICPAGYVCIHNGALIECWADLHFEFENHFSAIKTFSLATKEMVLYENMEVQNGRVICHPTTRSIVARLLPKEVKQVHVTSKPYGRTLYERGGAQYVLCSRIDKPLMPWERVSARHTPTMVWIHYIP